MRFLQVCTFLLIFATVVLAEPAPRCTELFGPSLSRRMAKPLVDKLSWKDWKVRLFEVRTSKPDRNGLVEVVRTSLYQTSMNEGRHESAAIYFSKRQAAKSNATIGDAAVLRRGRAEFNRIRKKAMKFVIDAYLLRRPHWPEKFRQKLLKLSKDYEKESTYILVENRAWEDLHNLYGEQKKPEIIGTIRLIHEKNGRIPMEDYLNIKIKTGANQMKVEPGNFAMLHEGNEIASVEFAIQLLAQMKRYREEFGKEPFFVTYADSYSEKLYGGMGFQYLQNHQVENPPPGSLGEKGMRITTGEGDEQVIWAPMFATEEMLTKHLEDRLLRSALKRENAELLQNFITAIDQTAKAVTHDPTVFVGFEKDRRLDSSFNDINRLFIFHEQGKVQLFLQHGYEYERGVMRSGEWIYLPEKIYDGWTGENAIGKLRYQNGILSFIEETIYEGRRYFTKVEIAIDADLSTPEWARVVSNLSGENKDYEVVF
jgi:hypothetical protein